MFKALPFIRWDDFAKILYVYVSGYRRKKKEKNSPLPFPSPPLSEE